jgi:hypothetical protein
MSLDRNFKKYLIKGETVDRLPRLEMMPYFDATVQRWRSEGLPDSVQTLAEFHDYFGLDQLDFFFCWPDIDGAGAREKISTAQDFSTARKNLYDLEKVRTSMDDYLLRLETIEKTDGIMWIAMHGFFWHPRDLFGVAEHMMMFYDNPELIHEINKSLLEFNISAVRMIYETGIPAIICVSEDMAYKNGSMISKELFDEFMLPYHRELLTELKKQFCVSAVDSDGDITDVTGWFAELGYDCINPLERQTGMDLMELRKNNPEIALLGGYNKRIMPDGPEAIYAEFDSLKPLFKQGRFIPAVDHQTPPDVSLENYRHYIKASELFFDEMTYKYIGRHQK